MQLPENLILVDKPSGMTSFDVIRVLRKMTGIKKWGHAGTLDPRATGLMVLAHDGGTKKLEQFIKLDKEYIAEIVLGLSTTTSDMDGEIVESIDAVNCTYEEIVSAVKSLVGTVRLPVSAYSAIKVDGIPMYKRAFKAAKEGKIVNDVPIRDMKVHIAELLKIESTIIHDGEKVVATVRFFVGSGTYIRSLAEELGRRLGYPATTKNLRRTKVGEFDILDAQQLDSLK